ncbi:hypothetical protein ACFSR9_09590, partial [Deinococcus taklimakanensis]
SSLPNPPNGWGIFGRNPWSITGDIERRGDERSIGAWREMQRNSVERLEKWWCRSSDLIG